MTTQRQRTVVLSWTQRRELEHARDHDPRPYVRERCAAVLKIADGVTAHAVARHGLLKPRDPDTLYAWLDRYATEGVTGLTGHRHGGYRRSRLRPRGADRPRTGSG
jgi:winged helix-turn helix protein